MEVDELRAARARAEHALQQFGAGDPRYKAAAAQFRQATDTARTSSPPESPRSPSAAHSPKPRTTSSSRDTLRASLLSADDRDETGELLAPKQIAAMSRVHRAERIVFWCCAIAFYVGAIILTLRRFIPKGSLTGTSLASALLDGQGEWKPWTSPDRWTSPGPVVLLSAGAVLFLLMVEVLVRKRTWRFWRLLAPALAEAQGDEGVWGLMKHFAGVVGPSKAVTSQETTACYRWSLLPDRSWVGLCVCVCVCACARGSRSSSLLRCSRCSRCRCWWR
eukprot:SAG22_NODE_67_length_22882_cov_25.671553_14_plen_277_part_00